MSVMRQPLARRTKNGSPSTFLKARTGEFTPPGMYCLATAKSLLERLDMAETLKFKIQNSKPKEEFR